MRFRPVCVFVAWVILFAASPAPAQSPPTAVLELLLPAGATATVNGQALPDPRTVVAKDFQPNEIRRLKVVATFADGATDDRLIDIAAGQRLRVAIPRPGPEIASVIGTQPLTPINSTAVSRDGRTIAVGLEDRSVVLWDTTAGRPVRTLTGHDKPVQAVAFAPDGKHLVSGSVDTTAILWNIETGARLRTFKGHAGPVVSVAVAPDGTKILTGSPDGAAILWDAHTGERVHTLKSKEVLGVAISPDGTTLATASGDATATLWDAVSGRSKVVLRGHSEGVICVTFSADGGRVLTGSSENRGLVWDAATGKRIVPTGRHDTDVYAVAFTPDGRRMLTGEREDHIKLWESGTGAYVRTFAGQTADIVSIVPNADGRTFLSGSRDGTARLWDLATGRELLALTTDSARKSWAVVSPDGLFDGSDAGRRAIGYRFPKGGLGEIDQFFAEGFHPGLLAQVWRGERPVPTRPLGRKKPPVVKLTAPKDRVATDASATLSAEIADGGDGISGIVVENNGVRLAVPVKQEPMPGGKSMRISFAVPLVPGTNRIGVRAADGEGSRESAAAEIELTHPRGPNRRGRLFVVAIGIGDRDSRSPKADAESVVRLLRDRGDRLFDRVDVVPVFDKEATRSTILDTVRDVAELSKPQDTVAVLLFGRGGMIGDRVQIEPSDFRSGDERSRAVLIEEIAAALGTAAALNRVLVAGMLERPGARPALDGPTMELRLRGAVERRERANGLHALVASDASESGRRLAQSLRDAVRDEAMDVAEWLRSAADRIAATPANRDAPRTIGTAGTRAKTFPLISRAK
ncbi:MAG: WD40 repeat domain-containing protein [Planctomycetia bacterium]|nr:WD40 repeat domain-containing protein [Planctomycetia bacterium]